MLRCKNRGLPTVHTGDIDQLGCPHRITAARTDILPAVRSGRAFDDGSIVVSGEARDPKEEELVAGDVDTV